MILSCDVLQIYFNEIPDETIEKLVCIVSCNLFLFVDVSYTDSASVRSYILLLSS